MIVEDSLRKLLSPDKIVLVGVSDNINKLSSRPLRLLKDFNYSGEVYPVVPDRNEIMGLKCYPDILKVPGEPDLAIYMGHGEELESVISKCGCKNIKFLIIMNSRMFENKNRDFDSQKLLCKAKENNVRLLGPDSQGIVNFSDNIPMTFSPVIPPENGNCGGTAYISQSGTFGFASYSIAAEQGVNFRYVITTGVQLDLDIVDMAMSVLDDPGVNMVVFYIERLQDGRRFLSFIEEARSRNVAVAVLKAGKTRDQYIDIKSSTAVLSSSNRVWESAMRQHGVIEISDINEIAGLACLFDQPVRPAGHNVGILSNSSGAALLMQDHCTKKGLAVNRVSFEFPESTSGSGLIDPLISNPFILDKEVFEDPGRFSLILEKMMDSDDIDIIVVIISMIMPEVSKQILRSIRKSLLKCKKPVVSIWLPAGNNETEEIYRLRKYGLNVFESFSECSHSLGSFVRWSCLKQDLKQIAEPVRSVSESDFPSELTEYTAKKLLSKFDIETTREFLCQTLEEAIYSADIIGYPVALKVMSPDILRKSEARVIALNLNNEEEVRNAYGRTLERASKSNPGARITGVLVQEMLQEGIECMIGARRDPVFGPVISVGLGGIYVEFLNDYSTMLAPVSVDKASDMINELEGSPLLRGLWGRKGFDTKALAHMVSRISNIIYSHDYILEININPVFVRETDAIVVDAFIVRRRA